MAPVDFLHHENPSTWAGAEPTNSGTESQRQTNHATQSTGGKHSPAPAPGVSAATAHKTFGPIDLTSTDSVCTRKVFGGIGHRTQAFRSRVRYPNH
ncbi:hypothetical protein TNCV_322161 [Trichonephila clavipes]|nr:hypothetical protein TNCV_322161 [Trichonephila clavipes]